jgi:replicative DNA helicase
MKAHHSERVVLGTLLMNPSLLSRVGASSNDFVDSRHRALFQEMESLLSKGHQANMPSVIEAILNRAEPMGGLAYVSEHGDHASVEAAMDRELRQVRERRDAIALSRRLEGLQHDLKMNGRSAFDVSGELLVTARQVSNHGRKTLNQSMDDLDQLFDAEADGTREVYMSTGIPEWDNNTNFQGISTEGCTLILGASGMGKSTFLGRLCVGLLSQGRSVYLHGTETSVSRRLRDLCYAVSQQDARLWSNLTKALAEMKAAGEWDVGLAHEVQTMRENLRDAQDWLASTNLTITGSGMNVEQIVATATNLHERKGLDCVIVDYLQDIGDSTGHGVRVGDRVQQVSHKSNALKNLSGALNIAVVMGAQVSGEKDGPGKDPRPQLWQTAWSATAHQDCEEAYALYVDDYYATRFPDWKPKGRPGTMEIIARKRRTGKLTTLEVPFKGAVKWCGGPLAIPQTQM